MRAAPVEYTPLIMDALAGGEWSWLSDISKNVLSTEDYETKHRSFYRRVMQMCDELIIDGEKIGRVWRIRLPAEKRAVYAHDFMRDPGNLWDKSKSRRRQYGVFDNWSPLRGYPSLEFTSKPGAKVRCLWAMQIPGTKYATPPDLDSLTDYQVMAEAENLLAYGVPLGSSHDDLSTAFLAADRELFPNNMKEVRRGVARCRQWSPEFTQWWSLESLEDLPRIYNRGPVSFKWRAGFGPTGALRSLIAAFPDRISQISGMEMGEIIIRHQRSISSGGPGVWAPIES